MVEETHQKWKIYINITLHVSHLPSNMNRDYNMHGVNTKGGK